MSSIDDEIKELSAAELRQLFDMLRMKNSRFEKDLYERFYHICKNISFGV